MVSYPKSILVNDRDDKHEHVTRSGQRNMREDWLGVGVLWEAVIIFAFKKRHKRRCLNENHA